MGEEEPPLLFPRSLFLGDVTAVVEAAAAFGEPGSVANNLSYVGSVFHSSSVLPPESEVQLLPAWANLVEIAQQLDEQWHRPMQRVAARRWIFWRCVAPKESDGQAWQREVSEAPREAWRYWSC